jgi:hypothetical protein
MTILLLSGSIVHCLPMPALGRPCARLTGLRLRTNLWMLLRVARLIQDLSGMQDHGDTFGLPVLRQDFVQRQVIDLSALIRENLSAVREWAEAVTTPVKSRSLWLSARKGGKQNAFTGIYCREGTGSEDQGVHGHSDSCHRGCPGGCTAILALRWKHLLRSMDGSLRLLQSVGLVLAHSALPGPAWVRSSFCPLPKLRPVIVRCLA